MYWSLINNFYSTVFWYDSHFFFFKQTTAYEIRLSLVGSEMCISASHDGVVAVTAGDDVVAGAASQIVVPGTTVDDAVVSYSNLTQPTNREV